ncbi:transposase [Streptomyces sp. ISL-12]|uniref:transposase n=1 Tax=Streptomyces sp. ISL-12 TaxID=2819177 RepID=UPI001BEA1321|nr:transposase [Streptomyces sp. ISL-12]MBT2413692.1 transposase [Streptomyces sp. ISL-12]
METGTLPPAPDISRFSITEHLITAGLWAAAQDVIPPPPRRRQGGGQSRVSDRRVLAAIVYAAVTGCAWRQVPPVFQVSWQTVHRRFTQWTAEGVWPSLDAALVRRFPPGGDPQALHRDRATCHAIIRRAAQGTTSCAAPAAARGR